MKTLRFLAIAVLAGCVASAWGQTRDPHIGYLYPAGGQQGSTFQIEVGGQNLRGVDGAFVSGEGITATVVEFVPPLPRNKFGDIGKHLRVLVKLRVEEFQLRRGIKPPKKADNAKDKQEELPELPDHPRLRGLEKMSLRELAHIRDLIYNPKSQPNAQIAEAVRVNIAIDAGAEPGDRELRLSTPRGLTNSMIIQVGTVPEYIEEEPNNPITVTQLPILSFPELKPLPVPVLMNGQIMPGDVDRFRFVAKKGQKLVMQADARHLVPYLADAVPGWFQATLSLFDGEGRELAFADDYHFDPDPVVFFEVPADGEYELEIRDSIYRGREDFVYRLSIGEQPFVTQTFPLGGAAGSDTKVSVSGWNLPGDSLALDTRPGGWRIRTAVVRKDGAISNTVPYAVDDLPDITETEPNNRADAAQQVELPIIINGRIGEPGDLDVFEFEGTHGDELVVEVLARKLNSPVDSLVRLSDLSGKVIAWNDDFVQKEGHLHTDPGLLTHHADSYLKTELPGDGVYRVQIADTQHAGGEEYAYRLRISPPQPDFELRVTPSTITANAGRPVEIHAHALRRDGFDGDIELTAVGGPLGFALQGAYIPGGRDHVRMTLLVPPQPLKEPATLQVVGSAHIGGDTVRRLAVPSDDTMQAFLWRHLAPAQEMMVAVNGANRWLPTFKLASVSRAEIPAGGATIIRYSPQRRTALENIKLELNGAPEGVSLQSVRVAPGALNLVLAADPEAVGVGYADNLIVDAYMEVDQKRPDGTIAETKRRIPLGVLPALPFKVVRGNT